MSSFESLVEVTRGDITESVHFGAVAVVDAEGTLLASAGDPHRVVFTRSSLKPFQAMPFVAQGGVQQFGLTEPELAVMCASHNGEDIHLEAVRSILSKIGRTEADLQCGTHVPYYITESGKQVVGKDDFGPVFNNCSGKHAGMLAYCKLVNAPHESYLEPGHRLQQAIKKSTAHFTGTPESKLKMGTDGCSAPNFALPLSGLAWAFARLAAFEHDSEYGTAPGQIYSAMTKNPRMVSGLGRGDLALMETGKGDWVSKAGGEAVQALGVKSRKIGIAVKVAGGGSRAVVPLMVEVLKQLELLADPSGTPLAVHARPAIKNHRGLVTGYIIPRFELDSAVTRTARKGASRAT